METEEIYKTNISRKKIIVKAILNYLNDANKFRSTVEGHQLTETIKSMPGFKYTFTDTILRYFRELKDSGQIDYICRDRKKSIYELTKFSIK
jgi:hypothetical protein